MVVNSGVANACTGERGLALLPEDGGGGAEVFGVTGTVLVASTGVIGQQLPIDRIKDGESIWPGGLAETSGAGQEGRRAIMTTDTVQKEAAVEIHFRTAEAVTRRHVQGLRHDPSEYVHHAFVSDDGRGIDQALLQKALRGHKDTYNMVSVDGDTSTNDTCLVLANGLAGNTLIEEKGRGLRDLQGGLHEVNEALAKKMAADGEGRPPVRGEGHQRGLEGGRQRSSPAPSSPRP